MKADGDVSARPLFGIPLRSGEEDAPFVENNPCLQRFSATPRKWQNDYDDAIVEGRFGKDGGGKNRGGMRTFAS